MICSMHLISIGPREVFGILIRELIIASPAVAPLVLLGFVLFGRNGDLWFLAVSAGRALGCNSDSDRSDKDSYTSHS